jgi:hypothetical protein
MLQKAVLAIHLVVHARGSLLTTLIDLPGGLAVVRKVLILVLVILTLTIMAASFAARLSSIWGLLHLVVSSSGSIRGNLVPVSLMWDEDY